MITRARPSRPTGMNQRSKIGTLAWLLLVAASAPAATTTFFHTNQVATLVSTGTTSDTISSEGYRFTYTRDKLFTGGVGLTNPVGRFTTINWPAGLQAQAVTAGPNPGKAMITIRRGDGGLFDLPAITFRLLANTAGAGGTLEIMPVRDGEDALNDPLPFDATGISGNQFTYTTAATPWGSTAALTNYEAYKIGLYVDFALMALTLVDHTVPSNRAPTGVSLAGHTVSENDPAGTWVGSLSAMDPDAGDAFTYALVAGPGGADNAAFELVGSELYTTASFNFETRSNCFIRVEVADQGLLATQAVFTVDLLDVDEPPPVFDGASGAEAGSIVLRWHALPNHLYTVHTSTNLLDGFTVLRSNLPPDVVMNCITDTLPAAGQKFWAITTEP